MKRAYTGYLPTLVGIALGLVLLSCTDTSRSQKLGIQQSDTVLSPIKEIPADYILESYYAAVYSHLYYGDVSRKTFFTAVLSLRNTSFQDTLYFTRVSYYNNEGDEIRSYLDSPVMLGPMASAEMVVEQQDTEGGVGANFVIDCARRPGGRNKPLIETIMLGTIGHHGFAFRTESVLIQDE